MNKGSFSFVKENLQQKKTVRENLQHQENQRFSGPKKTKVFFGKKTVRENLQERKTSGKKKK